MMHTHTCTISMANFQINQDRLFGCLISVFNLFLTCASSQEWSEFFYILLDIIYFCKSVSRLGPQSINCQQ